MRPNRMKSTPNRDKNGRFLKGQSGNPNGRPTADREFQDRCRLFMEQYGWDLLEGLAQRQGRDQRPTLELLAAYAYGKPPQELKHTGDKANPVAVTYSKVERDDETRTPLGGKARSGR